MGIIPGLKRKDATVENAQWLAKEIDKHHVTESDRVPAGFVMPITTSSARLRALKGNLTDSEFASYSGLLDAEIQFLFQYPGYDLSTMQLITVHRQTDTSILWLLGYHVPAEITLDNGDSEALLAFTRRNAADASLRKVPRKGFLSSYSRRTAERRVREGTLAIAACAAKYVARQHLPLGPEELMLLRGYPVYVEFSAFDARTDGWGICGGDHIVFERMTLLLTGLGQEFQVYQTPLLSF